MRKLTALILVPFMKVTGFRFSKEYRHAIDGWKLFVSIHVDTVQANLWAGGKMPNQCTITVSDDKSTYGKTLYRFEFKTIN